MKEERVAGLRAVEACCYGVCLFMLQEEKSAAKAAQAALTDLYRDAGFWHLPEEQRERQVCRVAAARALQWRKYHLIVNGRT